MQQPVSHAAQKRRLLKLYAVDEQDTQERQLVAQKDQNDSALEYLTAVFQASALAYGTAELVPVFVANLALLDPGSDLKFLGAATTATTLGEE